MEVTAGVLHAFRRSLRREEHVLTCQPDLVFQQLHNRLQWEEAPEIGDRLANGLAQRNRAGGRTWLRTLFRPPESEALVRTVTVNDPDRPDSVGAGVGVLSCAFSPDGRTVATAGGRTVTLWDVSSGVERITMHGHEDTVWACALSPDGTRVVSAAHDHTLRIWDTTTGGQVGILTGHSGPVVGCAFSPEGRRVVSASWDNTARIWNLAAGGGSIVLSPSHTPQQEIEDGGNYRRRVDACAFSPDGRSVISVVDDLVEWDAATGARIRQLRGGTCCAYSPDGRTVLSLDHAPYAGWPAQVLVQQQEGDGETRQVLLRSHVRAVACSPDGSRFVTAGEDGVLRIWDLFTGDELTALSGHSGEVLCCAYSPDGTLLASGGADGTLRFWDAVRLAPSFPTMSHQDAIWACAFSHGGDRIVSGSENLHLPGEPSHPDLMVWDAGSGAALAQPDGDANGVIACAFSPDDTRVASVTKRGPPMMVALWDSRTGVGLRRLSHTAVLADCAFSPTGTEIVAASWDDTVRVWNVADGSEMAPLVGRTKVGDWELLQCCAFSADGGMVAAGGSEGALRLWDHRTGAELGVLAGVVGDVQCCAFSPDGRLLVGGTWDGSLAIWDIGTRSVVTVLAGHREVVRSCAFAADGSWVVSGSDDGTVRVWDPATGWQVAVLPVVGAVLAVAAHPRLPRVAFGGTDGVLRVLDVVRP